MCKAHLKSAGTNNVLTEVVDRYKQEPVKN